jgi:hypothetical protein
VAAAAAGVAAVAADLREAAAGFLAAAGRAGAAAGSAPAAAVATPEEAVAAAEEEALGLAAGTGAGVAEAAAAGEAADVAGAAGGFLTARFEPCGRSGFWWDSSRARRFKRLIRRWRRRLSSRSFSLIRTGSLSQRLAGCQLAGC